MATYQVLYWHTIPVQVRARDSSGRAGAQLPERFQQAVDQAAMAAGLTGSDAYAEGFRWGEPLERAGAACEVADAVAAEIDVQHEAIDWRAVARGLRGA
jgi:hypothetical protein